MILLVQLGLRAVLQREAMCRTILLVIGSALAAAAVLAAVAAPQVTGREQSRAATPVVEDSSMARSLGFRSTEHDYRGRRITIAKVAALDSQAPTPVGVERLPAPGEALVSPALADRLTKDATVRRWFPYRWSVLPREAVGSAGQLMAYVGAEPSSFDRSREVPQVASLVDRRFAHGGGGGRLPVLGLVLFCVLPALGFVAVCARVGSVVQRRRTVALRLLGVSRRGAALVAWIEVAPWAAVGGFAGWIGYLVASRAVTTLPIVGRRFFAADAAMAAPAALSVIALVALLAGALSAVAALSAGRLSKTSRPALDHRLTSRWTLVMGAAGLGMLGWAYLRRRAGDPVLTAAIILYGIGLPSTTMLVVQLLAARLARWPVPTSVLLGLRRLEADPGRAVRVAGVAALAVYAVCVAQPVTQVLDAAHGDWLDAARIARPVGIVGTVEGLSTEPLRLTEPTPPSVAAILPIVDLTEQVPGGQRPPRALIASCRQMQDVARSPILGCVDTPLQLRTTTGRDATPEGTLSLTPGAVAGQADWIIPPAWARAEGVWSHEQRGAVVDVEPTLEAWERAQAWIVASDPSYRITNYFQTNVRSATVGLWLLLGVTVASILTVLAGAVLAFESALLRKGELFALRAIGVSRKRLQRAQLAEGLLAGAVAIGLAMLGSLGATATYWHMLRDDPFPSLTPYLLAAVGGLGAVVAVAWSSSLVVVRRLSPV